MMKNSSKILSRCRSDEVGDPSKYGEQEKTSGRAARTDLPIMTSRQMKEPITGYRRPRQVWLESLESTENEKLGIVDLHPDVFAFNPRLDIIYENLRWQGVYRTVDYRSITTRSDLPYRSNRKPWPQKGTGRARHGTRRSPLFLGGGQSKGPRGPQAHFYILPDTVRLAGLLSSLSIRYAQDDLHVVDSFESLPSDEPSFLEQLIVDRAWGDSILFVNKTDVAPLNLARACSQVAHFNILPVYGLNVWSVVKHDAVVLSLEALESLEEKLLFQLNKCDVRTLKNPTWSEPITTHGTGYRLNELSHRFQ